MTTSFCSISHLHLKKLMFVHSIVPLFFGQDLHTMITITEYCILNQSNTVTPLRASVYVAGCDVIDTCIPDPLTESVSSRSSARTCKCLRDSRSERVLIRSDKKATCSVVRHSIVVRPQLYDPKTVTDASVICQLHADTCVCHRVLLIYCVRRKWHKV